MFTALRFRLRKKRSHCFQDIYLSQLIIIVNPCRLFALKEVSLTLFISVLNLLKLILIKLTKSRVRSQESEIINREREISMPKNGDMVLINNGIFYGYQAIFKKKSDKDRVILLLKLLQQEQRIQFFNDQFEVI